MAGAVAARLDSIKAHAGIRGREVATLVGATPQTVSRWQQGRVDPQPAHLIHGRGARGWTQQQLADELGTTNTAVSRIESGRHAVSLDTLQRLSDVLGVAFTIGPTKMPTARIA